MYDYIFCFVKREDILLFVELIKRFRSLRIIECEYDKKYKDYYIRMQKNLHIEDYGFNDFFENFDMEYEPS